MQSLQTIGMHADHICCLRRCSAVVIRPALGHHVQRACWRLRGCVCRSGGCARAPRFGQQRHGGLADGCQWRTELVRLISQQRCGQHSGGRSVSHQCVPAHLYARDQVILPESSHPAGPQRCSVLPTGSLPEPVRDALSAAGDAAQAATQQAAAAAAAAPIPATAIAAGAVAAPILIWSRRAGGYGGLVEPVGALEVLQARQPHISS